MRLDRITILVGVLFAIGASAVFAQSEWIYAVSGSSYLVLSPVDGTVIHRGLLQTADYTPGESPSGAETPQIVPTPGGRYVFFFYPGDNTAVVVDAETHQPVWSVALPTGTQKLVFSSMGQTILAHTGGTSWFELPHQRGRVVGPGRRAPSFSGGTVTFNRRATRVYGNRGTDLIFALASSGDPVQTVSLEAGPYDWQISPNFRFLIGLSESRMVVVDESRGRVVGYLSGRFAGGLFHPSSREFYALTSNGDSIVVVDTTRGGERTRIHPSLPLAAIFRQDNGALHGLVSGGANAVTGGASLLLDITGSQRRVDLPGEFAAGGMDVVATLVTLRPGGGFACF